MARATYLAPGVYVEEVPSAQQPIAGVGTNTVAFIGLIPKDKIKIPKPNNDYDPELAKQKSGGADQHTAGKQQLEREIRSLEEQKAEAEQKIQALDEELGKPDLPQNRKKSAETERNGKKTEVTELEKQINEKKKKVADLRKSPVADESKLRPYILDDSPVKQKPGVPKLCTNFSEYRDRFGDFSADDPDKPGEALDPGHRALTHAVWGFFKNGGTRCFVTRIKNQAELPRALETIESIDAVSIVAAPGLEGSATWSALVSHCETCQDRFAILDCAPEIETKDELDLTKLNYDTQDRMLPQRNKNAAFYFPYIRVVDTAKMLQDQDPVREIPLKHRGKVYVPPSGHVAGIYARTDEERGVHKAPANAAVLGAVGVKYYIGKTKHELLNPQGVNVIRDINGNYAVWGARTVGGDSNGEWKYVNVRRLFLFLRGSIDEGTQWVVFEPNDRALWGKIRRNVGAFLTNVWRSGALFGSTPEEAFYVKCDDETNPLEVREQGQVITEIGIAIVRPAEFVIFRITQSAGQQTG